jgi:FkbM family methyltransferase
MSVITSLKQYLRNVRIIGKTFSGVYEFTWQDRFLYFRYAESPGPEKKYPVIRKTGTDSSFISLNIGGFMYYWPCRFDLDGLSYMHQEVFASVKCNPHSYEYDKAFLKKGDTVIDAGACEGFFTRYALEHGSTVISIEPVKILADALRMTFANEIAEGRVSLINNAIGSCTREGFLSADPAKIFESHLDDTGDCVTISKLDDIVTVKIDFIKMDIEGAEIEAIYGAKRIIRRYKPNLSIAVYHNYENARKIIEYLHEICPEYTIVHRGIYAYNNESPRPMMVYAWS